MHLGRMKTLRDFLSTLPPHKFNMASWFHLKDKTSVKRMDMLDSECQTTACVAGWAVVLFGERDFIRKAEYLWIQRDAQRLLDLTEIQANRLFGGRIGHDHALVSSKHWLGSLSNHEMAGQLQALIRREERTRFFFPWRRDPMT